jgi:phosphatidylglycerophosphatase C
VTGAPAAPRLEVAAFDFDGTLTRRDTLLPYLQRGLGWPRFLWALLLSSPWLLAFALRLMSNHRAKARLLAVCLGGRPEAELARWTADFVEKQLPKLWQADMLARLAQHQQQGHCCVIVSASPGLYLHRIGRALGVEAVICTELESQAGVLTGQLAGPNCHGQEKVRRLQAWLAQRGVVQAPVLHAYGDSAGDVPLLNLADYGWYKGQPRAPHRPAR